MKPICSASNLIPVSLHQLAYIINQRGVTEVVVCGLRQSGRTGLTRVLAQVLASFNPLWEAVAPEELIEAESMDTNRKLEAAVLGDVFEVPTVTRLNTTGHVVRQGELREAETPLPEGTLRLMLDTRRPHFGAQLGNSAIFVTLDGLCYHAGIGFDGTGEVPRYLLQGAPTWVNSSQLAQDLMAADRKNDLDMFFEFQHAGYINHLDLLRFGEPTEWPEGLEVVDIQRKVPVEWKQHMLTFNLLHPVYDAIRQAKKKPIPFQVTGHDAKKVNEVAAILSDMARLNLHPQPLKDDGYVVQKVVVGNHPQYSAFIRYVNPKDTNDTYEHIFVSSPNEMAVYQAALLASNRLSVMLEVPRKMFGHDVLTIGSL